ncbi:MAG: Flp pilus assembly protein CpaB [Candidatus Eiseniibacteriota bacterium]
MTPRTMILIFAALLTAGGTIFFAQSWISRERAQLEAMKKQPVKEQGPEILVAKKNMPAGLFVKPEDVEWRPWPKEGVVPSYYLKGKVEKTALIGAVVRRGIMAGEPMSDGKIAKPGDQGFLAAVLEPGMRAVTVSINQTSGIAGFVFPGDRVDLLLTKQIPDIDGSGQRRFATETVLEKIRVLAMDQRVNDIENTPKVSRTMTVEVTPKQAEMIAVAGQLGTLSLSLRSLAREEYPKELKELKDAKAGTVAGAPKEELAKSDKPEKGKPDNAVAADSTETQPPVRGKTVTFDSEASRLVAPPSNNNQVLIIRGAKTQSVRTEGATDGGKSAPSADDSAAPGAQPDADGSGNPAGSGGAAPGNQSSVGTGAANQASAAAVNLLSSGRLAPMTLCPGC